MMKNDNLFVKVLFLFTSFIFLIFFVQPHIIEYLFNTLLGNFILLGMTLGIGMINYKWAIGLASIIIILNQSFRKIEPFSNKKKHTKWSKELIDHFIKIVKLHHPHHNFDIDIIQKQATPYEAEYFLKHGHWYWSPDVQQMYKDALNESFFIKTHLGTALQDAQTIYNETAIKQILSWNTKEGTFLLSGAIIGNTPKLPNNINNIIRCGSDGMEKVVYTGYNSFNYSLKSTITPVDNSDIPSIVNGFAFLDKPCNPCVAIDNKHSCPFSLNTGSGPSVSPIWKKLWGIHE